VRLIPEGVSAAGKLLYWGRAFRAFGDGFVSLLLPVYLTALGFDAFGVGVVTAATLLGSAAATLGVGFAARRLGRRALLVAATLLMIGTGVGFVAETRFWPLVVIAFVGTINPSPADVSLFLPLEQAVLADSVPAGSRTSAFALYSLVGSLVGALGALAAGLPDLVRPLFGVGLIPALQAMFGLYAVLGLASFYLYRRLPPALDRKTEKKSAPLGPSRRVVLTLAALFSLDAFGGGLIVQSLLALWMFERFSLSLAAAGTVFFWSGLLSAASFLFAASIARRIGLVHTMVFTHLPSNLLLLAMAVSPSLWMVIALWFLRCAMSQLDVPARSSYVMAVVTPAERLAAALSPALAGWLLAASPFGWPLIVAGILKGTYDLLLLVLFRSHKPPEEIA
jgi:Major Facilitator Superfamily